MNFKLKRTDRIGRITIDSDLLKEIFEKINGQFIHDKIEILSIEYDSKKEFIMLIAIPKNFQSLLWVQLFLSFMNYVQEKI